MTSGASFHASAVITTASGPRIVIFGGQRTGLSEEMWLLETTGDGWSQCFKPTETTPWPAARTQMSLNAVGAEPQTRLVLFGGYDGTTWLNDMHEYNFLLEKCLPDSLRSPAM